jgi:hypothetical protein
MAYKDLGPNVSQFPQEILPGLGLYTADDHSWESVVLQQEKPVTDWEMNLVQEALGRSGNMGPASKLLPSCFISNTFSDRSDILGDYVFLTPDPGPATTANKFYLKSSELIVNGWRIRFDLTDLTTQGFNQIQLPIPPIGGQRTDLVILEVWRALVSPAPSMGNKSVSGQILRYGNAKSPDQFPPGNQNLADDLIDPTYAQESARRVQIQYRYRVIPGIDIETYPDGLEDPTVFGNTVPYLGISGVDGSATAYLYERASYDTGLWVAGENNATGVTNLGTVDGYVYAIPICAVARRSSSGFDRSISLNGGVLMTSLTSDRPDGLFADQITPGDLLDLRRGVAWDFNEVLDKTFQEVLSNTLTTKTETLVTRSGTSIFAVDELEPLSSMGVPDGVRTTFSDRRVTESVVDSQAVVGPTNSILISLTAINTHWGSPFNLVTNSPLGVSVSSVTKVRIYDGLTTDYDALIGGSPKVVAVTLTAAGSYIDTATIVFDATISGVTVLTELLIDYPGGNGALRNVVSPYALWIPPAANVAPWLDVTASTFTATSDLTRNALYGSSTYPGPLWKCDPTHRELSVRLRTTVQNWTAVADGVTDTIWLPDILDPNVPPTLNGGYIVSASTAWTTFTAIQLTVIPPGGTQIIITYQARRPLPPLQAFPGDSYQFFYESRAIQSNPVPAGGVTFNLVPRAIGKSLHSVLTGPGSPDSGSPFISPSEQIPIGIIPGISEFELDSPSSIGVLGLDLTNGYVSVPTVIPYTPDASKTTLYSDAPDQTVDSEGRNFWPKSDNVVGAVYKPLAIGPALSTNVKHKVAIPVLMEVKQDMPSSPPFKFRKGTLVLVVFTRWVESDENSISLSSSLSSSCAAVYRVRGNLLNPKRSSGVDPGPSV